MRQTRAVAWEQEVPCAAFDQDLLYSFGAFKTVCRVRRNDAKARVASALNRDAVVSSAPSEASSENR